jgi:hypothetical protein
LWRLLNSVYTYYKLNSWHTMFTMYGHTYTHSLAAKKNVFEAICLDRTKSIDSNSLGLENFSTLHTHVDAERRNAIIGIV